METEIKKIVDDIRNTKIDNKAKIALFEKMAMDAQIAKDYVKMGDLNNAKHEFILENFEVCGVEYGDFHNCKWWDYEEEYCILLEVDKPPYTPRCEHSCFRFIHNENHKVEIVNREIVSSEVKVNCESADGSDHVVLDGNPKTGSHWHWKTKEFGKPVLAVDFHHVITTHCSACPGEKLQDTSTNGEVQDGCIEALNDLAKTYRIMIYTGAGEFWDEQHRKVGIEDWLKTKGIPYDEIRYGKPPACFIIDDRAIHHVGWAETLDEIRRRESGAIPKYCKKCPDCEGTGIRKISTNKPFDCVLCGGKGYVEEITIVRMWPESNDNNGVIKKFKSYEEA